MKIDMTMRLRVVLLLLLTVWVPLLSAQSAGTGALTGTVTDPSGAVIPNVVVTVTSTDTGQVRTVNTGSDGGYRFNLLPPGTYKVKFTANGFKTAEVPSVKVNVTETPTLNYSLEVGTQAEAVEVQADAAIIQTTTSTLGTVVGTRTVTGLPLSNRNYTQIVNLSAGVAAPVNNASAFGKATQDMSTNGNDPAQNNFQMDGVAIDNIANSGSSNDSGIYAGIGIPSPDAIQEFKIQTSTYDASYGRNPGANVNVVTKSGTNQFHGTAFEFFRNSDLNANDFFFNRSPANTGKKQVLNQNQFGGTFGGPLKKDKLFFFGSYQGTRQKNGVAVQGRTSYNLLPNIPLGDRSGGLGSPFAQALAAANCHLPGFGPPLACDGSNLSPVGLKIAQLKNSDGSYYIPSAQQFGFGPGLFSQPAIYKEDQVLINGDYLVNAKNTLAMRYFHTRNPQEITLNGQLPGAPTHQYYSNDNAVLKLTTLVSNSFINEARVSFQRNMAQATDSLPPGATSQNLGTTPMIPSTVAGGVNIAPGQTEPPFMVMIINGFNMFGGLNPSFSPTNQRQAADQISWTHGKHTIRAGFEYEHTDWPIVFAGLERGFFLMGSFNDVLVGGPGSIFECLFCVRSGPQGIIHGYQLPNMNSYFQDDWKVNNKLTLNLGVRWEFDGTLSDKYGNLTTTWLSQLQKVPNSQVPSGPSQPGAYNAANFSGWVVPNNYAAHYPAPPPGVLVSDRSLPIRQHPPYSNFGPRIGFAYQVSNKLVIRGGAGIFYDRVGADRFVHSVEQGNPYAVTLDYLPGNQFTLANPFPDAPVVGQFAQRWIKPNCDTLPGGCAAQNVNSSYLNVPFINEVMHTPTVRQYNMTFQYNFASSWVLEAGFVGSNGINLTDYNHNYNVAGIATPSHPVNGVTKTTQANVLLRVPYLGYQAAGLQGTAYDLTESYNSFQATVRRQFSHGFLMQAAYTFSKSLTNSFTNTANGNLSTDTAQQYGPSNFNRPSRLIVNYGYDLPFGKHQGVVGKLAEGWNISGVTTVQSGQPLTIIDSSGGTAYGTSSTTTQGGYSRAQLCPGVTYGQVGSSGGLEQRLNQYFNKQAFCAPPLIGDPELQRDGTIRASATAFGNSGVGIIQGPGQFNWDATLMKNTSIGEHQTVQFRAEFFNLFNHAQFSNPNAFPAAFSDVNSASFGQITSTSVNPRVIQLALKYTF